MFKKRGTSKNQTNLNQEVSSIDINEPEGAEFKQK